MAEWSIASVLKTEELQGSVGSNPTLSVLYMKSLEIIHWLDSEIDKINSEAATIGEMLLEETCIECIQKLDIKLQELEEKMIYLQQKIQFEKAQINKK